MGNNPQGERRHHARDRKENALERVIANEAPFVIGRNQQQQNGRNDGHVGEHSGYVIGEAAAACKLRLGWWRNRGNAWRSRGDYARAIADYDEAIRLNPREAYSYQNRGAAKQALGDLDGALADINQALDADTYSGYTVVNADPFASYVTENPDNYHEGLYTGISINYTPLIGFESIVINISVSQFAS